MDLPDKIKELKKSLGKRSFKQGDVVRIAGNYPFESNKLHVFIVLNKKPGEDVVLVAVNGTTQIEKRYAYYHRLGIPDDDMPLVSIERGKYSFFSKDTVVDCNTVSEINLDTIDFKCIFFENKHIDQGDLSNIIAKVLNSDEISLYHKRLIEPNCK